MFNNMTEVLDRPEVATPNDTSLSSKVILFNDEIHDIDEVIQQIVKAISCSESKAEDLAWEVNNKGKACVYDGEMDECLRVSGCLEEIGLHTQIEC